MFKNNNPTVLDIPSKLDSKDILDKLNPIDTFLDYLKTKEKEVSRRKAIEEQSKCILENLKNQRIESEKFISEEYRRHNKFLDTASHAVDDALAKNKDGLVLDTLDRMLDALDKSPIEKLKTHYNNNSSNRYLNQ